jgi:hypothetical protein
MKLRANFPGLATALKKPDIAFGRRGFCIKSPGLLYEGQSHSRATQRVLSGQGVVRWVDQQQSQIEITCLADECRTWVLGVV